MQQTEEIIRRNRKKLLNNRHTTLRTPKRFLYRGYHLSRLREAQRLRLAREGRRLRPESYPMAILSNIRRTCNRYNIRLNSRTQDRIR